MFNDMFAMSLQKTNIFKIWMHIHIKLNHEQSNVILNVECGKFTR